jgi:glycosyltransferase involved in cell wall biosynthesis
MRLTFTIYSLEAGGAQRVATLLANAFAERGHDVTILTFTGGEPPFYPLDARIAHRHLGPSGARAGAAQKLWANVRRVARLRAALRRSAADTIVSFIDQMNVVTSMASIGLGARVVVTERVDPAMAPISATWKRLRDWSYRLADAIVMQTAQAAGSLPEAARRRSVVIPNPVRAPAPRPDRPPHADRRLIVGIGRLVPQKGFPVLVQSFARLQQEFPAWDLAILGEGPERGALESLIAREGLAGRVRLPGIIADVGEYLSIADLFVLPSLFEGFPNALCEAMSWGLPVIASDCRSGPAEIVRDGVDGVLVPPGDAGALATAMRRLMADETQRARLGAAATQVATRYGLPEVVRAWEAVIGGDRPATEGRDARR